MLFIGCASTPLDMILIIILAEHVKNNNLGDSHLMTIYFLHAPSTKSFQQNKKKLLILKIKKKTPTMNNKFL